MKRAGIWLFCGMLTLAIAAPGSAHACTCEYAGGFTSVAKDASLILKGKVLSHGPKDEERPLFMNFQIQEVLSGSYSPGPIRVWGDNGFQCRPPIKQFPQGSEWILAVLGPEIKPSGEGEHYLSNCGQYWLQVDGAYIKGNISGLTLGTVTQMPMVEFRRLLKKMGR